MIRTDYIAFLS